MNYPKCPACGNPEVNQFASGKFHCPYCGTAFTSDGSICEKPVERPVEKPVMNETAVSQNAVQGNDGAGKSKSHKALLLGVGALVVGAIVFAVVKGVSTKSNTESPQVDVAVTEATASFPTGTENGHEWDVYNVACERELTESDVCNLSKKELRIMRNWIYARHGYIFKSEDLKDYFSQFSWYEPRYTNVNRMLSRVELRNVDFIKQYE